MKPLLWTLFWHPDFPLRLQSLIQWTPPSLRSPLNSPFIIHTIQFSKISSLKQHSKTFNTIAKFPLPTNPTCSIYSPKYFIFLIKYALNHEITTLVTWIHNMMWHSFFQICITLSTSADIRASTAACFLSPSAGDFIKCLAKAKCKLTVSYKPRSTSVLFETSE